MSFSEGVFLLAMASVFVWRYPKKRPQMGRASSSRILGFSHSQANPPGRLIPDLEVDSSNSSGLALQIVTSRPVHLSSSVLIAPLIFGEMY